MGSSKDAVSVGSSKPDEGIACAGEQRGGDRPDEAGDLSKDASGLIEKGRALLERQQITLEQAIEAGKLVQQFKKPHQWETESEQLYNEVAVRAQLPYLNLMAIPDDATQVVIHTFQVFGSVPKALGWLQDACSALDGSVPIQLLLAGEKAKVEDELVRIEEGIYV